MWPLPGNLLGVNYNVILVVRMWDKILVPGSRLVQDCRGYRHYIIWQALFTVTSKRQKQKNCQFLVLFGRLLVKGYNLHLSYFYTWVNVFSLWLNQYIERQSDECYLESCHYSHGAVKATEAVEVVNLVTDNCCRATRKWAREIRQ